MTDWKTLADSAGTTLADPRRLDALARTGLFIEPPLPSTSRIFDRLTALTARLLHAPISTVTLVSDQQQLFVGATGIAGGRERADLCNSYCQQVVASGKPLAIRDVPAADDPRLNSAAAEYGIVAYCGVPISVDGQTIGTLCAIGAEPRDWTDADLATLADLAELVEREIALQITQREEALVPRRFEPLLNAIPAGIYACDEDGRLIFYNDRAAALWGTNPSLGAMEAAAYAVRGLAWQDGTPLAEADTPLRQALRGAIPARPLELALGQGPEALVALASAQPLLSAAGERAGALGVLQDVTALRQASRLRDELLALVSHELRTPLTVISGMASFLDRHGESTATGRAEAIKTLLLASRRMERVVENMLQLSHLDHDRAEPEPLLAQKLLDEALTAFAPDFPATAVSQVVGERGAVVFAVEAWSALALINLLQNAQLYGDGSEPPSVQLVRHGVELHIRVCNPGETFTEDGYLALFEPFYRSPRVRNQIPGAGLGLTTARKLADAQGGRLLAGQRPDGHGSMFTLALPLYQQAGAPLALAP